MFETCSKLTKNSSRRSDVLIINFKQISNIVLVFPLLTLILFLDHKLKLKYRTIIQFQTFLHFINSFHALVSFDTPCKHQKTFNILLDKYRAIAQ